MEVYPFLPLTAVVILTALFWRLEATLRAAWIGAGLVTILCCLSDWYLVARLPKLGLSFGPINPQVFMLNFLRLIPLLLALALIGISHQVWQRLVILALVGLLQVFFLGILRTGLYMEPFRLTVSEVPIQNSPAFLPDRPLRVLQLSDLHMEHITIREKTVLEKTNALAPDLIVLTGDYLNKSFAYDPQVRQEARQWLSQLHAPYGVYAVNGNVDYPGVIPALFDGLKNIRVLHNEIVPISLPGGTLYLVGALTENHRLDFDRIEALLKKLPPHVYSLLLYHFPERADVASDYGVNVMLAGDTHGGQVRLPLIGSAIAYHLFKPYVMGKYQVGSTTLYVSRGLGMQGGVWPRIRLNCPPEMVLVDIGR